LEQIKDFADKAHGNQTRKYTPDRYIVHPIRVMKLCQEYTNDIAILGAALLHDVLEDTAVTEKEIFDFLSTVIDYEKARHTTTLVAELTDEYIKDKYPQWNRRKRKEKERERLANTSGDAQTVKYADIIDNGTEIVYQDKDFAPVFLNECNKLLKQMTKGEPLLRERALAAIQDGLKKLSGRNSN
jgi:(p)ppGpp synthase/HD superfamily hydrolase